MSLLYLALDTIKALSLVLYPQLYKCKLKYNTIQYHYVTVKTWQTYHRITKKQNMQIIENNILQNTT